MAHTRFRWDLGDRLGGRTKVHEWLHAIVADCGNGGCDGRKHQPIGRSYAKSSVVNRLYCLDRHRSSRDGHSRYISLRRVCRNRPLNLCCNDPGRYRRTQASWKLIFANEATRRLTVGSVKSVSLLSLFLSHTLLNLRILLFRSE